MPNRKTDPTALPANDDLLEDLVPLDPGEPEPVGELHFVEDALPDDELDLDPHEPEASRLQVDPELEGLLDPLDGLDLEDFATQEELPILPWCLDVLLLEPGHSVPAQLEPTLAESLLERPGGGPALDVTLRIRMLDLRVTLPVQDGPTERLRIGRDLLAGRILVRVDA